MITVHDVTKATKKECLKLFLELEDFENEKLNGLVPSRYRKAFRIVLNSDVQKFIYAKVDGEIVGVMSYDVIPTAVAIDRLFVKEEYRNSGVGSRLVETVISEYPHKDFLVGALYTPEVVKFYERFGLVGYLVSMIKPTTGDN